MYRQKCFVKCILLLSLFPGTRSWLVTSSSQILSSLFRCSQTNAVVLSAVPSDDSGAKDSKVDDLNMKNLQQQETVVVPQANYGVSFMGGDPCGSKYNDDPFDAAKSDKKPGIPDDVKARIAALAEQKKKEILQAKKEQQDKSESCE